MLPRRPLLQQHSNKIGRSGQNQHANTLLHFDSAQQVTWECQRPESWFYEPGPEPAVIVTPPALHNDMENLLRDRRFADVRFCLQVGEWENACLVVSPLKTINDSED